MTKSQFKHDLLKLKPWGIISAFHESDASDYITQGFNDLHNKIDTLRLAVDLDNGYLDVHEMSHCYWKGKREISFYVRGISREQIIKLGRKYDQEYVIFNGDLIATRTSERFPLEEVLWLDEADTHSSSGIDLSDGILYFKLIFGERV